MLLLPPPVQQLLSFTPPVVSLPPSTGAPRPMTGLIGKRNLQPRSWVTGNTAFTYRVRYPVTRTATGIQMEFPAWSTVLAGTGDEPAGNTITLAAVYCEYGGSLFPVTFGGATSVVVPSGLTQKSDVVAGLTVAANTILYIRTYVTVTSGGRWPGLYGAFSYPDELGAPGNFANATGDLSGATGNTNAAVFGPIQVWGTYGLGQAFNSITVCGDSIAAGTNDSFANEADTGYYQRALWPGDRPFSIVALPGENGQQLLSQGNNRADIVGEFVDYVIFEYGINDLQSGSDLAQLQARAFANTVISRNLWVDGVWQQTLGPKTSSTDAWATTTNQTPDSINTARVQFNDWVRDGMPESGGVAVPTGTVVAVRAGQGGHPFRGYVEVADLCETGRNSGIWKPSWTNDGLHPNTTGNTGVAALLDLSQFVDTNPTIAPPQALVHDPSSFPLTSSAFQGSAASQAYTSPTFSPPAGSVIVIGAQAVESFNNAWNLPTITDSLTTHLTWTRVTQQADVSTAAADGTAALFWAACPTAQTNMTVTVTQSLAGSGQTITFSSLVGDVWTNADTTNPIPSFTKGTSTATTLSVSFTPTGANSASLILANNAAAASGVSSAGAGAYLVGETHTGTSFVEAWYGNASGPTVPAGTQNLALNGATPRWQYIVYEIASAPATDTAVMSLAGQNILTVSGTTTGGGQSAAVSFDSTSTLDVTAGVTETPTVPLAQSSALTVAPLITETPAVPLAGSNTLAVAPTVTHPATVALAQTSALTVTGVVTESPAVTLAGTSALTVAGVVTHPATVALAQTSALAVTPLVVETPTIPLVGTSTLAVTADVAHPATVAVPAGAIAVTGTAPAAAGAVGVAVPAGQATITATGPTITIGSGTNTAVPAGQVTLTATAPAVGVGSGQTLAVPPGQATITGTAPVVSVGVGQGVAVPAGLLSLTGTAPTVVIGSGTNTAIPAGQLAATATAPAVTIGASVVVAVPPGQLAAASTAPTVTAAAGVLVPAGAVALSGAAPAVVVGGSINIAIPAGQATLTGAGPAVRGTASIAVPAGQSTLTGASPGVASSSGTTVPVPAGAIAVTGTAPVVRGGIGVTITVAAGQIVVTGTPPAVVYGIGRNIPVPAGGLTLTAPVPEVPSNRYTFRLHPSVTYRP